MPTNARATRTQGDRRDPEDPVFPAVGRWRRGLLSDRRARPAHPRSLGHLGGCNPRLQSPGGQRRGRRGRWPASPRQATSARPTRRRWRSPRSSWLWSRAMATAASGSAIAARMPTRRSCARSPPRPGAPRFVSFIGGTHGGLSASLAVSGYNALQLNTVSSAHPGQIYLPYPDPYRPAFPGRRRPAGARLFRVSARDDSAAGADRRACSSRR